MSDKRVGHGEVWPEVSASGRAYQRPATTLHIGDGYFIVLDDGTDVWLIDELSKSVNKKKKPAPDEKTGA